jgi:hypothetical protein
VKVLMDELELKCFLTDNSDFAALESVLNRKEVGQAFSLADHLLASLEYLSSKEWKGFAAAVAQWSCKKSFDLLAWENCLRYAKFSISLDAELAAGTRTPSEEEKRELQMFAIHLNRARALVGILDFQKAQMELEELLRQQRTDLQRMQCCRELIQLKLVLGEYDAAVEIGVFNLAKIGVVIPTVPTQEEAVGLYMKAIGNRAHQEAAAKKKTFSAFLFPPCDDEVWIEADSVLAFLVSAAYLIQNPLLIMYLAATSLSNAVERGRTPFTAFSFGSAAFCELHLLTPNTAQVNYLLEMQDAMNIGADRALGVGRGISQLGMISHVHFPLARASALLERGFVACTEAGDLAYACYASYCHVSLEFTRGAHLTKISRLSEGYLPFLAAVGVQDMLVAITGMRLAASLLTTASSPQRVREIRELESKTDETSFRKPAALVHLMLVYHCLRRDADASKKRPMCFFFISFFFLVLLHTLFF